MALFRRWLLILSALALGGGPLFAAGSREQRAYTAAVEQFQDQLWDRAETQLAQFVKNYRASTNVPMAVLLQAQAKFKQGRFSDAAALLATNRPSAGNLADQYLRWIGEAQFARGNYSEAAETFARLAETFPDSPLSLGAIVEAAAACEKLGEPGRARLDELLSATNGVFARTAQLDPDNEQVASGRLLLAQSRFSRNNFAGADAVLGRLNPQTLAPEQDYQRLHLLSRVKTAVNDLDAALSATTNLMQVARLQKNAARQAESVALHGTLLEKKNLLPEAVLAWQENLTNSAPAERQREAILKIAALAAAQNNFMDAAAMLDRFLAQSPKSPVAELALLTAGELSLREFAAQPAASNQLALAREKFDRLLAADTNSALAGRAFLDRGWCRWLAGNTNDSLADFQKAALNLPASEDLAVAKFKTGDVLFLREEFSGARMNYQSVLEDFGDFPAVAQSLGARALYQILRADLKLDDLAGAEAAMRQLLEKFPASELADNSLLLVGEAFSDFGRPANAFQAFQDFGKQFPGSPLLPQAEFAAAQTFEREQNWPAAITNYEAWLKNFPTNGLRPQVKFALAQAQFHAGNEAGAFALFTGFVTEFPTNRLAPLAQWWVADHFFRATNFAGVENFFAAETNYENIFQNPAWENSEVFYQARLMAGRAAMGRLGFSDASRYFVWLINNATNCPLELRVQARFAYGHALMQSDATDTNKLAASFQSAIGVFDQVRQLCPTNEWGARAWSETGDCNMQLGDMDAATNAYAQVVNSPVSGAGLRSRARVWLGLALEKKAALLPPSERNPLLTLALENYQAVLYPDVGDSFWTKKAGLQALPLMIALQTGDVGALITRMEGWFPQLKDSLEKKRAALGAVKN